MFTCEEGCSCDPMEVDALREDEMVSISAYTRIVVTQSECCEMAVKLLPRLQDGRHNETKFKLIGLVIKEQLAV